MTQIERDIRCWIGDGKTFVGMGEHGLVRAIIEGFSESYPAHVEQMEILEWAATVCGYDGVLRMLGSAICESDGDRTLTLKAVS